MGEKVSTVRIMVIDWECPACSLGRMYYTGAAIQTQDGNMLYHHICSRCDHQDTYPRIYPMHTKMGECTEMYDG